MDGSELSRALDLAHKIVQLMFYTIYIGIMVAGFFSQLDAFGKGFVLGGGVMFFVMIATEIYRKHRKRKQESPAPKQGLPEQPPISEKPTGVPPAETLQVPDKDPVSIAHKDVQERWGRDVRIVHWQDTIEDKDDRIIVSGIGTDDQQRKHPYRVPVTKDGKIIWKEVIAG